MMTRQTAAHAMPARTLSRRTLFYQAAAAGLAATALASLSAPRGRAADALSTGMDALLQRAIDSGAPGVSLRVERAGELLYAGRAGFSNLEAKTPLANADRFRIYSITKTFTATVTLQLVDEGVLTLDDTVTRWLDDPAVARIPNVDRITLRQLLTHTSGIYDYLDDNDSPFWADAFLGEGADWTRVWTIPELLAYVDGSHHPPYFEPDAGWYYANTNYLLLGMVIEAATGRPFADELRDRILTPLALADTTLEMGKALPDDLADGYQNYDGQLLNVTAINLTWAWTVGGIVSTTADLARFARAVFAGELLSPAARAEMFTFVPMGREGLACGMGLFQQASPNGDLVGMDGGGPGGTSTMYRLGVEDVTAVVLANYAPDEGATDGVRDEAINAVLNSG